MATCLNESWIVPTQRDTYVILLNRNTSGWNCTNQTREKPSNVTAKSGDGPFSNEFETWLIVLFTFTTILAIVGNTFVILVFGRGKLSRTDLQPFLINLAISDLIMAIFCMPFTFIYTTLTAWIFSKPMCPVVLFVQLLSVFGSVFTNVAIGIDRFLAVKFPMRSKLTKKKAKYVIFIIWMCSIGLCSIQFKVGQAVERPDGVLRCEEVWASEDDRKTYTLVLFVIAYVIPLLALLITYSIIGFLLWKRTSPGNKDHARDMQQLRSKRKVVKMLVIVVATFGICWFPLHFFTILIDFYPAVIQVVSMDTLSGLYISAHWLAMSNSFANPLIYGLTNKSFRADLVALIYTCCPCCFCLRKFLMHQSSGSSSETVVLQGPSFYKQKSRTINRSFENQVLREFRESSLYRSGTCTRKGRTTRTLMLHRETKLPT